MNRPVGLIVTAALVLAALAASGAGENPAAEVGSGEASLTILASAEGRGETLPCG